MSLMMSCAIVILVFVGFVYCEENKENTAVDLKLSTASNVEANSTSSVVIENKVQNVSVDYKNDHKMQQNSSYTLEKFSASNKTSEKPLIISTSKEFRLIQTPRLQTDPPSNDSHISRKDGSALSQSNPSKLSFNIGRNIKEGSYNLHFQPNITSGNNHSSKQESQPFSNNYARSSYKTSKWKNFSSQIDFEKMNVKEMRLYEDVKENPKFRFYVVSDANITDSNHMFKKNKTDLSDRFKVPFAAIKGTKILQNEEDVKTPYYNSQFSQKPFFHTNVKTTLKNYATIQPGKVNARPIYHSTSITSSQPPSYVTKFNLSSYSTLTENENPPPRDFSCLRCVGHKGNLQFKPPIYPSNKGLTSSSEFRPIKLQDPGSDSVLEGSNHFYATTRKLHPHTNITKPNVKFSKHVKLPELRKPYSLSQYSGKMEGFAELSTARPGKLFLNDSLLRGFKTHQESDLYNLDELESSGSSNEKNHIKYETKEIHIPYPVRIEKKVPYPIHIKVERLVPIHVDKPFPVHIEKKIPVPVKVHVPQPYPVEKEVPYPVKIPVEVPRPVQVHKPVPYLVENPVPVQVIKHIKFPVKVPVDVPVPYKVPIQVEKRVPYFVEEKVPFEVPVPVEKPHFIEVKKPFEVPVEKPYPVYVEKKIAVPVEVVEFVKMSIPVKSTSDHHLGHPHRLDNAGISEPRFADLKPAASLARTEMSGPDGNQNVNEETSEKTNKRSDAQFSTLEGHLIELPFSEPNHQENPEIFEALSDNHYPIF